MSKEKLKGIDETYNGIVNATRNYKKRIVGEILTIIDASIPQGQQNKSTKDLINQAIWNTGGDGGYSNEERNMIEWLQWLNENQGDRDGSKPFLYEHFRALRLDQYNK